MTPPASSNLSTLSESLPKYGRPPVVEVALSAQFTELSGFQPIHFGLLAELWRDRFPDASHHPPLPTRIELLESTGGRGMDVAIAEEFPVGRYWFASTDGHYLVQIQRDRFVYNWRKLETDRTYPSYDRLRAEFEVELSRFLGFAKREHLGDFEPTQVELTYINHIPTGEQSINQAVADVTALWSGRMSDDLAEPEDVRLQWRYRQKHQGKAVGRLYIDLRTARRRSDGQQLVLLELTGRGAPLASNVDGLLAFADLAHQWIVRGFTSVTTHKMHRLWERTQ